VVDSGQDKQAPTIGEAIIHSVDMLKAETKKKIFLSGKMLQPYLSPENR
jgi:hypothetical protein